MSHYKKMLKSEWTMLNQEPGTYLWHVCRSRSARVSTTKRCHVAYHLPGMGPN